MAKVYLNKTLLNYNIEGFYPFYKDITIDDKTTFNSISKDYKDAIVYDYEYTKYVPMLEKGNYGYYKFKLFAKNDKNYKLSGLALYGSKLNISNQIAKKTSKELLGFILFDNEIKFENLNNYEFCLVFKTELEDITSESLGSVMKNCITYENNRYISEKDLLVLDGENYTNHLSIIKEGTDYSVLYNNPYLVLIAYKENDYSVPLQFVNKNLSACVDLDVKNNTFRFIDSYYGTNSLSSVFLNYNNIKTNSYTNYNSNNNTLINGSNDNVFINSYSNNFNNPIVYNSPDKVRNVNSRSWVNPLIDHTLINSYTCFESNFEQNISGKYISLNSIGVKGYSHPTNRPSTYINTINTMLNNNNNVYIGVHNSTANYDKIATGGLDEDKFYDENDEKNSVYIGFEGLAYVNGYTNQNKILFGKWNEDSNTELEKDSNIIISYGNNSAVTNDLICYNKDNLLIHDTSYGVPFMPYTNDELINSIKKHNKTISFNSKGITWSDGPWYDENTLSGTTLYKDLAKKWASLDNENTYSKIIKNMTSKTLVLYCSKTDSNDLINLLNKISDLYQSIWGMVNPAQIKCVCYVCNDTEEDHNVKSYRLMPGCCKKFCFKYDSKLKEMIYIEADT